MLLVKHVCMKLGFITQRKQIVLFCPKWPLSTPPLYRYRSPLCKSRRKALIVFQERHERFRPGDLQLMTYLTLWFQIIDNILLKEENNLERCTSKPVNPAVSFSASLSASQSVNKLAVQSVSISLKQSVSQCITPSVNQSVSRLQWNASPWLSLNRTNGSDNRVRLRTNFLSITCCAIKGKEIR